MTWAQHLATRFFFCTPLLCPQALFTKKLKKKNSQSAQKFYRFNDFWTSIEASSLRPPNDRFLTEKSAWREGFMVIAVDRANCRRRHQKVHREIEKRRCRHPVRQTHYPESKRWDKQIGKSERIPKDHTQIPLIQNVTINLVSLWLFWSPRSLWTLPRTWTPLKWGKNPLKN